MLFKDKPSWLKTKINYELYNKFAEALTMDDKNYKHNIALMPNYESGVEYVVTYLYAVNKVMNDTDNYLFEKYMRAKKNGITNTFPDIHTYFKNCTRMRFMKNTITNHEDSRKVDPVDYGIGHKFNNIHKVIELLLGFDFTYYFDIISNDEEVLDPIRNNNPDTIPTGLSVIYDILYLLLELYTNKYITKEVDDIKSHSAVDKIMYQFKRHGFYWWIDEEGFYLESFIVKHILLDDGILMNSSLDTLWNYCNKQGLDSETDITNFAKKYIMSEKSLLLYYPVEYHDDESGRYTTEAIASEVLRIMSRTDIPNNPSLWTSLYDHIEIHYGQSYYHHHLNPRYL